MQQPNVLFKVDLQGPSIGVIVANKHFAPLSQLEKYGVSVRVHFGQTQVGGNDGLFVQADGRSKAALDGRAVDKMQKSSSFIRRIDETRFANHFHSRRRSCRRRCRKIGHGWLS